MSQIIIGYLTVGTTDSRFLESIITRTFVKVAFECKGQIEVVEPLVHLVKERGMPFSDQVVACCLQADRLGVMAVCVHTDADSYSVANVMQSKITPAMQRLNAQKNAVCKNVVPVIPVQMTEAWMLADTQLLKEEIGTELEDSELGLHKHPEKVSDPKSVINNAIRIAHSRLSQRRRRNLEIGELYRPIGQKIGLNNLEPLESYAAFCHSVRNAYRNLNYLH